MKSSSTATTGAPCRQTSCEQRGDVGFGHEDDVIARAQARGGREQLAVVALEQLAVDERHTVDDRDACPARRPHAPRSKKPSSSRSPTASALAPSRASSHSRNCRPIGAATPRPSSARRHLVERHARLDDLGRLKRILVGIGLLALARDAAPLLERVAAADQRGVDDEPAAGFDPALELRAPRVVDVPAPRREHDDGVAAACRRATRAARSSRRASRRASAPHRTGSWRHRRAAASVSRPRPIRCCRRSTPRRAARTATRTMASALGRLHAAPLRSSAAANSRAQAPARRRPQARARRRRPRPTSRRDATRSARRGSAAAAERARGTRLPWTTRESAPRARARGATACRGTSSASAARCSPRSQSASAAAPTSSGRLSGRMSRSRTWLGATNCLRHARQAALAHEPRDEEREQRDRERGQHPDEQPARFGDPVEQAAEPARERVHPLPPPRLVGDGLGLLPLAAC